MSSILTGPTYLVYMQFAKTTGSFLLIKRFQLQYIWGVKPKQVAHVGAHLAEEIEYYKKLGVEKTLWIEAMPHLVETLKSRFKDDSSNLVYSGAIVDRDNSEVILNETNNSQSSSVLMLKEHLVVYPQIVNTATHSVKGHRLDSVLNETDFIPNLLVLDIQGAELLALKGSIGILDKIEFIFLEVNLKEMYEGCPLINEIDEFLLDFNFVRVDTCLWRTFRWIGRNHGWGDALYVKKKKFKVLEIQFRRLIRVLSQPIIELINYLISRVSKAAFKVVFGMSKRHKN